MEHVRKIKNPHALASQYQTCAIEVRCDKASYAVIIALIVNFLRKKKNLGKCFRPSSAFKTKTKIRAELISDQCCS